EPHPPLPDEPAQPLPAASPGSPGESRRSGCGERFRGYAYRLHKESAPALTLPLPDRSTGHAPGLPTPPSKKSRDSTAGDPAAVPERPREDRACGTNGVRPPPWPAETHPLHPLPPTPGRSTPAKFLSPPVPCGFVPLHTLFGFSAPPPSPGQRHDHRDNRSGEIPPKQLPCGRKKPLFVGASVPAPKRCAFCWRDTGEPASGPGSTPPFPESRPAARDPPSSPSSNRI